MPRGRVKFFNHKNKFGFIIVDNTKDEIYVHAKDLLEGITDNDLVEFEIAMAKRGPTAVGVKKLKE